MNMRRLFLSVLTLVTVAVYGQNPYDKYYTDLPCAVEHVQPVVIPDYTVTLTDFGAVGDGQTDCSEAFAQALKLLKKQGYKFWREVYYHGVAGCKFKSKYLDLLNWADMRIDSSGNEVSLDGRLEELSQRYNVPIPKLNSYPIVCELKSKGYK